MLLATVGIGGHYVIDLVAALPLAAASAWITSRIRGRSSVAGPPLGIASGTSDDTGRQQRSDRGGMGTGMDRVPPHDLLAEQSTIGGMLLSKDAVADVIETVRGMDFYVPKHEVIYDAILGLYSHGEPTDVITVSDELMKSGDLSRAGGAEYLHTLTGVVPTAANAGYYHGTANYNGSTFGSIGGTSFNSYSSGTVSVSGYDAGQAQVHQDQGRLLRPGERDRFLRGPRLQDHVARRLQDLGHELRVEGARDLVEQKEVRLHRERPDDRHPLLLAT